MFNLIARRNNIGVRATPRSHRPSVETRESCGSGDRRFKILPRQPVTRRVAAQAGLPTPRLVVSCGTSMALALREEPQPVSRGGRQAADPSSAARQGSRSRSAHRPERVAQLLGEGLRLLPRGEVTALRCVVEIGQVRVDLLGPGARGLEELLREDREPGRHVDIRRLRPEARAAMMFWKFSQ